jgi:hypothetical protein
MSGKEELTEKDRERIYWRITVLLLISTPLLIAVSAGSYAGINTNELEFSGLILLYFIGTGLGSIIAVMLIEMLISPERKIWIKAPSVTVEHRIKGDVKEWIDRHFTRLHQAGFGYKPIDDGWQWQIQKSKKARVHSFIDNSFSGEVRVRKDSFGNKASMTLVFNDIVIIDSGESSHLNKLASSLLDDSEGPNIEPAGTLTLYSSVVLGVVSHLSCYAEIFFKPDFHLPVFEAAFLSAGEAVWMAVVISMKRKELIGMRIALAMILAGSAPFIALLVGKIFFAFPA